mgnify:CR=1 FL=1
MQKCVSASVFSSPNILPLVSLPVVSLPVIGNIRGTDNVDMLISAYTLGTHNLFCDNTETQDLIEITVSNR